MPRRGLRRQPPRCGRRRARRRAPASRRPSSPPPSPGPDGVAPADEVGDAARAASVSCRAPSSTRSACPPTVGRLVRELAESSLKAASHAALDAVRGAAVLRESSLIASATTAKPRPASPARAASIFALMARMFTCEAMEAMSRLFCSTASSTSSIFASALPGRGPSWRRRASQTPADRMASEDPCTASSASDVRSRTSPSVEPTRSLPRMTSPAMSLARRRTSSSIR